MDLSEKLYYSNLKIETVSDINNEMYSMYKVNSLNEDKYVFFSYEKSYFFQDNYINPFEICIDNVDENICVKNVSYYKFNKANKYTIYIHFVPNYYNNKYLFYFPFSFSPISQTVNKLETIKQGYYTSLEPKLYILNIEEDQSLFGYFEDCQKIFISLTNEEIKKDNLDILDNLIYEEYPSDTEVYLNSSKYGIIVVIPKNNKLAKFAIADSFLYDCINGICKFPEGKTQIINLKNNLKTTENLNRFYNILTTFSSSEKNMISLKDNEKKDFLVQNTEVPPIYVDKSSKDINLEIKILYPKYAYFKVFNPDIFNDYLSFFVKNYYNYKLNDINEIFPINIRINSNMNIFYDFINLCFYNFNENINLYINQIYGDTDLYEYNEDFINNKDLSSLQNPIISCKDKLSIFNRIITFNDKKLISGYISHNSYFDIYLDKLDISENNDDDKKIKISSLGKGINNSTSKYIKSGIDYTIDFELEHIIKIDPIFNAEVSIRDNKDRLIATLNNDNPKVELIGNNYKIKSNRDTMVYFYGKLFNRTNKNRYRKCR